VSDARGLFERLLRRLKAGLQTAYISQLVLRRAA